VTDPTLEILPAAAWADRVASRLADRLKAEPALRLCLPTGETPAPLYGSLVRLAGAGAVSFGGATVVLLDEYVGLDADDPARCIAQLRDQLLDRVDPPPARVHAIDVDERGPQAAAAELDRVAADGLDLALVGLGLNGHIGMNEPGSDAASPTRVVELDAPTAEVAVGRYGAARRPAAGVTLGMDRLLAARELWLLVTGERKAEVLERALRGPETPACPASYLRRHPRLVVFADEPAAALLERASGAAGEPLPA
jgi:glucosamine-6-phosphate deaminase